MTSKKEMMENAIVGSQKVLAEYFEIAWPPYLMKRMNEWGLIKMLETDLALRMGFKVTIKN